MVCLKKLLFHFILLSTKINIATNSIFRSTPILSASLFGASSSSKFIDSEQITLANLIERTLSEF